MKQNITQPDNTHTLISLEKSLTTFPENYSKNIYSEIQFEQQIPVYIPSYIHSKIRHLCDQISQIEWIGLLFFRTSGKFATPGFRCIIQEVYPMEIGTENHADFEFKNGVAAYLQANPHLRGACIGNIHSHHNMPVFFSDEDMGELHKNAENHNIYLSLIVNNREEMIAKLCFLATRRSAVNSTLEFLDEKGAPSKIVLEDYSNSNDVLGIYDCEIIHYSSEIDENFRNRCTVLKEKKSGRYEPEKANKKKKSSPQQVEMFKPDITSPVTKTKRKIKPAKATSQKKKQKHIKLTQK
ncbi:hypothetical protein HGH93_23540 [Chitinophaga polysaccharea]|uniref:hypothetical protein n=1 Tax=Chitinophaga polysaccharea TaxID=1293035 RepID=UPI0014552CE6|nr:hypothetical protein [Chitinophaga polysaccharea]NLR61095.1 hypothetical protein [Chitinophaga polysaccharea]